MSVLTSQTRPVPPDCRRLHILWRERHLFQLAALEHRRLIIVEGRVGAITLAVRQDRVRVRRIRELDREDPAVAALRCTLAIGLVAKPEHPEAAEIAVAATDGNIDAADADTMDVSPRDIRRTVALRCLVHRPRKRAHRAGRIAKAARR